MKKGGGSFFRVWTIKESMDFLIIIYKFKSHITIVGMGEKNHRFMLDYEEN